jgi:CubicO group peptidase (beta-lactamase class C family)
MREAPMTTTIGIKGECKDGFQRVKDAFAANFEDHGEVGASLAVMVDGEMAVDIWGGYADGQRTRPWERDTIVNTFSTTKGMTAICANQLIEQGKLDPEAPVAKYWPEFAQAGKDKLPVQYLLNHKAGLPAVDNMIPASEGYKWKALVNALAAQKPWWEPGTQHGYHAVTFGSLVGEVVRRVSGMSVGNYFRKQVAEPLGIDFYIGFGPELDSRCADMIPAPFQAPPPEHPLFAAFTNPLSMTFKAFMITPEPMLNPNYMNTREFRAAEVPAANGHGNARALATVYGALARGGELGGVQVLQRETIDEMRKEQSNGEDAVLMIASRFGRGFFLELPEYALTPNTSLFGHPGMGGSFGLADPDAKVGIGYAMNKMYLPPDMISLDPRWAPIFAAVYDSL